MGYDFLAIKALVARGHITGVGRQIGVGKESDIFEVREPWPPWAVVCVINTWVTWCVWGGAWSTVTMPGWCQDG
jgi:hypothetical protein